MKFMLLGINISLLGIAALIMHIPGLVPGTYPYILVLAGLIFSMVGLLVNDDKK